MEIDKMAENRDNVGILEDYKDEDSVKVLIIQLEKSSTEALVIKLIIIIVTKEFLIKNKLLKLFKVYSKEDLQAIIINKFIQFKI